MAMTSAIMWSGFSRIQKRRELKLISYWLLDAYNSMKIGSDGMKGTFIERGTLTAQRCHIKSSQRHSFASVQGFTHLLIWSFLQLCGCLRTSNVNNQVPCLHMTTLSNYSGSGLLYLVVINSTMVSFL